MSTDFAPKVSTSYVSFLTTLIRTIYTVARYENPISWTLVRGRRNDAADFEGPFYIMDAPSRQIDDGKAVVAPVDYMKASVPYLLTLRILNPDGGPIPNAVVDIWHADSKGDYYFLDYTLRGKATTDANGYVDILTIPPGMYGVELFKRAGHFHMIIRPPKSMSGKIHELTTQLYVCQGNDTKWTQTDMLNWVRKPRLGNCIQSWSIPSANNGQEFWGFAELSKDDTETRSRVQRWNKILAEKADGLQVVCGGSLEIKMSKRTGWF